MRVLIVAMSVLWIRSGSAFAQQPAQNQKAAEDLSVSGTTAYNLGRFDEAADLFSKAYEAWPQPESLYNIAQSHRQAGNCKQALHLYKRFRSLKDQDTADPLSQKKRDEIEQFIRELTECVEKANRSAGSKPDTIEKLRRTNQDTEDHSGDRDANRDRDDHGAKRTKGLTAEPELKNDEGGDNAVAKEQPSTGPKLIVAHLTGGFAMISAGDLGIPIQPSLGLIGGYPIHVAPVTIEVGAALSYTPLPYAVMGQQKRGTILGFRVAGVASYPIMPKFSVRGNLGLGGLSLRGLEAGNPISTDHKAGAFTLPSIGLGVAVDYEFRPNFVATVSPLSLAFSPGVDGMYASSLREIDIVIGIGYRQ